jgi:hypothetical protein
MSEKLQRIDGGADIAPWPAGWPLPLTAVLPGMRWEDVIEAYIAYCEAIWGVKEDTLTLAG